MADGINAGPDYLQKSLLMHQAMEDTPFNQPNQQAMGNPQQMMQYLQDPHVQQLLGQYGVHFDPSKIQQSPFFQNSFMQGHPGVGGALTGALSNLAMTPAAPLVSGAGSGLSRFAQGAQGGPENIRQFQLRQLMAPLNQVGAQMPMMGEQRRQQLNTAMISSMDDRQRLMQEDEQRRQQQDQMTNQLKQQAEDNKSRNATERINATRGDFFTDPKSGLTFEHYYDASANQGAGGWAVRVAQLPADSQKTGRQGQGPSDPRLNPNYQPGTKGKGAGAKSATPKQLADLESKKAGAYARLHKDYDPYFGGDKTPPPAGYSKQQWSDEEARKTKEFPQREQEIENQYGQERALMGAPVPGYQYPGQQYQGPGMDYYNNSSIMNPGGQGQQQGGQQSGAPPPGAVERRQASDGSWHFVDQSGMSLGPASPPLSGRPNQ